MVTQIISISAVKIMWTDLRTIYEIKLKRFFDYFDLRSEAEVSTIKFICMLFLFVDILIF